MTDEGQDVINSKIKIDIALSVLSSYECEGAPAVLAVAIIVQELTKLKEKK